MIRNHHPKRILMTADTVGGVWTYAMELAAGLQRHGTEVILATMGQPPQPAQRAQVQLLGNVTLCEGDYRLERMPEPWEDVRKAGLWLQSLESRFQPDVIHLNGYVHAACRWKAPVLAVAHSCVLSWWQAVRNEAAPRSWRHYEQEVRRGIQAADHVVAPTSFMMAEVARHYGPLPPHRVIANGRDPFRFRRAGKEAFILSAGRLWDEAKNASVLCRIAGDLPWPLRVAGDASPPGGGTPQALPNIEYVGQCDESTLADLYSRAAIYALPARYEPFGLTVLEAALSGCALVIGDIPSLRELWQDAAVFVSPHDPEAWRQALRALINDPVKTAHLGKKARRRALRFSTARCASSYLELYQSLLASRASRRATLSAA